MRTGARITLTVLLLGSLVLVGGPTQTVRARAVGKWATADFNGDGFADLAVGLPGEAFHRQPEAGAVRVIYGSSGGLQRTGNQLWSEGDIGRSPAIGDQFGFALATGDFNGKGFADLAIGVPTKGSPVEEAGAVDVLYGSANGLSASGNQEWTRDSPGVLGKETVGAQFGRALAVGDFNGDGYADLAIAVPLDSSRTGSEIGAVNILYGGPDGLTASNNQLWTPDSPGIIDHGESGTLFGFSLAAGDFNHDGYTDLAIGSPDDGIPGEAGAVDILYGSPAGLTTSGYQFWSERSKGIRGGAAPADRFGYALSAGDFTGNGYDDLAIGSPFKAVGKALSAGAVDVLYGSSSGLMTAGSQFWSQAGPIQGSPAYAHEFGFSLAAGDFNGDGRADLAVGVPGQDIYRLGQAGASIVIYGSSAGLTATGNQMWSLDSPGIFGRSEANDRCGFSVTAADYGMGPQADLAMGCPGEDVGRIKDAGGVSVIYGSPSGLAPLGNQYWHPGNIGQPHPGDLFGYSLGP